eukprot:gi/632951537/ref/XP_007891347.1/ PREDICTED: cytochrome b5 reductase 4-like [Callorhinchus milii]
MDWIRLTKSGKDLTGLKGRLIEVPEEELAKHNKKDDCWICIRGMVYNLTPYLEYHPGGEEELMRGAGIDGTELFDQIHRWVNYESMLKECLIGRMALKPASINKVSDRSRVKMSTRTLLNGASVPGAGFEKTLRDVSLRYEWFQTEDAVTVVIYTKQKDINSDSVIIDLAEGVLRTEVRLEESSYVFHMRSQLQHARIRTWESQALDVMCIPQVSDSIFLLQAICFRIRLVPNLPFLYVNLDQMLRQVIHRYQANLDHVLTAVHSHMPAAVTF